MTQDFLIVDKAAIIDPTATIMAFSVIGKTYRRLLTNEDYHISKSTIIGSNVYIGYSCIIGKGSYLMDNCILDDHTTIECEVEIGQKSLLIYSSHICNEVKIGKGCVIGGLIGENTIIGDDCKIFGNIVHAQNNPGNGWDLDSSMEGPARIFDKVFIGFNSIIIGNVSIGPKAYVCAGCIISKSVPEGFIAEPGVNKIIHHSKSISKLKNSNIFK